MFELIAILGGVLFIAWGLGSLTQSNLTIRKQQGAPPTPRAGCLGLLADLLMVGGAALALLAIVILLLAAALVAETL
jgi:hypothetical protein